MEFAVAAPECIDGSAGAEGGEKRFSNGTSIDSASGEAAEFLLAGRDWEQSKRLIVNQALPKFDIAGEADLMEGLRALGVTDVFDSGRADFSPMTEASEGIYVSQVKHAARVAIDEEGVTAAAYTVMDAAGSDMPPEEEVDFVADRPFLFAVTGPSGQLLFAGVVNQPV